MINPSLINRILVTRRNVLAASAALAATACMPRSKLENSAKEPIFEGPKSTSTITTKDSANIFYKDWGSGQPIVFSHGWPLTADAWDEQLFFFASNGYRAIAHDRRGHGRSSQTWSGNDIDTYADDLASLVEKLGLHDAIIVGHSTGGGEVARYLGRHGTSRVAKAALVSSVTPLMVKTEAHPSGVPMSVFDGLRDGLLKDKAQLYKDLAAPFFGANRPGSKSSVGLEEQFWLQCMQAGFKAAYDCVKAGSEVDYTEDLKKIEVPVLLVHGEEDQFVPINETAKRSLGLLKRPTLKSYPGAPHGLTATHRDQFNADLLAFIRA